MQKNHLELNPANEQLSFKGEFSGQAFYSIFSHSISQILLGACCTGTEMSKTSFQPSELQKQGMELSHQQHKEASRQASR